MNIERIFAVIQRDFWLVKRLRWRMMETFFFPISTIFLWGFFTIWAKNLSFEIAFVLLAANIFWSLAYSSQSSSNFAIMEDRYSESFPQIMLSPIRPIEYLFGKIIGGLFISLIVFSLVLIAAYFIFDFGLLYVNPIHFTLLAAITIIFSISISILVESSILVLGNEWGFLSWGAMEVIMFLSAPLFPVATYPDLVRNISILIPYTWVFESLRSLVTTNNIPAMYLVNGFVLAIIFFLISLPIYTRMLEYSRKIGKLHKMW